MGSYTVVGNVGREIRLNDSAGGKWLTFSVCETRRFLDRQSGEWRDGPPTWIEVKVSGDLAVHAEKSLRTGQRVIVHGDLAERHWTAPDGTPRSKFRVNAAALGHDLRWGVSSFARWAADDGWRGRGAVNTTTGEIRDDLPAFGSRPLTDDDAPDDDVLDAPEDVLDDDAHAAADGGPLRRSA